MIKKPDQEIRNAWFDLAEEIEKECGDWWNAPDNPELTQRILDAAKARLEQQKEQAI